MSNNSESKFKDLTWKEQWNNLTWKDVLPPKDPEVWVFSTDPSSKVKTYFFIKGFPLLDALIFWLFAPPAILLLIAIGIILFLIAVGLLLIAVGLLFFAFLVMIAISLYTLYYQFAFAF